ncbi:EI24 domain-containing protein [Crocinitomix catalasitica]|uniref:EI24 domain-containing protein n=1 Tax=Crocinitomix catalasitica TaxID=184607 RepID=UPI0006873AC6|nr:EI24 domain-containing protein [Crocinitomix catalasitica]
MNFFQLIGLGYKNYIYGIKFLVEHKLYWYIAFPLILFAGVYLLGFYFEDLQLEVAQELKDKNQDITRLKDLTWISIKMIFFDSMNLIFTKFTLYIVVIILSPILALLSERIEKIITGNKYKFSFRQLLKDIRRGLQIALRNIFWEYFFIVIILGLATFFGGGIKDIIIFSLPIMIGFYFYGFAFIDYVNERRRLNIQQSIYFVSKHRGLAIAIGSIYSIFFLSFFYVFRSYGDLPTDTATQLFWGTILVITFILASMAPILAITSATLSMHELVDLSKNDYVEHPKNAKDLDENEDKIVDTVDNISKTQVDISVDEDADKTK